MPKRKPYTPNKVTCPKCGEVIEGDMPVISHAILGCNSKK